jgi:hypothetical protein
MASQSTGHFPSGAYSARSLFIVPDGPVNAGRSGRICRSDQNAWFGTTAGPKSDTATTPPGEDNVGSEVGLGVDLKPKPRRNLGLTA